jgi:hypothetical protein
VILFRTEEASGRSEALEREVRAFIDLNRESVMKEWNGEFRYVTLALSNRGHTPHAGQDREGHQGGAH